jgi:hypothetical protein
VCWRSSPLLNRAAVGRRNESPPPGCAASRRLGRIHAKRCINKSPVALLWARCSAAR